jgi:regulator of nucleoside diphosphate kinase
MPGKDACVLTTKDYSILEMMLERQPADTALAMLLRHKIDTAQIVFGQDINPAIVTLGSRTTYRVDDQPAQTRVVTHDHMRGLVGLLLPITNLRGLALLGLAEGESITIISNDDNEEMITVQAVVYQPEASRREAANLKKKGDLAQSAGRPFLQLIQGSLDGDPKPLRAQRLVHASPDSEHEDPDPGPSAA